MARERTMSWKFRRWHSDLSELYTIIIDQLRLLYFSSAMIFPIDYGSHSSIPFGSVIDFSDSDKDGSCKPLRKPLILGMAVIDGRPQP